MPLWYNKRKSVYYTPPAGNLSRVRIFLTLFGNAHAQLYQNPSDLWYNKRKIAYDMFPAEIVDDAKKVPLGSKTYVAGDMLYF